MAATNTVYTATQTAAFCDDSKLNPAATEVDAEVHITLQNRTAAGIAMEDIYDALDAEFGTVACNKLPTRNSAIFVIS